MRSLRVLASSCEAPPTLTALNLARVRRRAPKLGCIARSRSRTVTVVDTRAPKCAPLRSRLRFPSSRILLVAKDVEWTAASACVSRKEKEPVETACLSGCLCRALNVGVSFFFPLFVRCFLQLPGSPLLRLLAGFRAAQTKYSPQTFHVHYFESKSNLRSICTQHFCWKWARHHSCWTHKGCNSTCVLTSL